MTQGSGDQGSDDLAHHRVWPTMGLVPDRSGKGGVAQLGERLLCKQEVIGSIPFTSTTAPPPGHLHHGPPRTGRRTATGPAELGMRTLGSRGAWLPAGMLIDRVKRRVECDRGGRPLGAGAGLCPDSGPMVCRSVFMEKWLPCPAIGAGSEYLTADIRYLSPGVFIVGCGVEAKRRASGGCLGTERR